MSIVPGSYQSPYTTAVPSNQQVVIPQITIPQPWTQTQNPYTSIQTHQLDKIKNLDDAKRFSTLANSRYALFMEDDDVMYIKETDNNNYPTLTRYRFYQEDEPIPEAPVEYVTKDELKSYKLITIDEYNSLIENMEKLKEEVANAKQSVRSSTTTKRSVAAVNDD